MNYMLLSNSNSYTLHELLLEYLTKNNAYARSTFKYLKAGIVPVNLYWILYRH